MSRLTEGLLCSFCEKSQEVVGKLISSPNNGKSQSYICDKCVGVCVEIMVDDNGTFPFQEVFGKDVTIRECLTDFEANGGSVDAKLPDLFLALLKRRERVRVEKLNTDLAACRAKLLAEKETLHLLDKQLSDSQVAYNKVKAKVDELDREKMELESELRRLRQ